MLETVLQVKVVINPLFDENALISLDQGPIKDHIRGGVWQLMAPFHLKFEKWDKFKHSRPVVTKGFGGLPKINDLPLDYWRRRTFEVIGDHFEGLESITSETINLLNCREARIKVKRNLCGYIPSTIEIKNPRRGNIFLHFGDKEQMNPPKYIKKNLLFMILKMP